MRNKSKTHFYLIVISLIFYIFLNPHRLKNSGSLKQIIIWNVGQGQWVTYSDISSCLHFDMGGEFFNKKSLSKTCANKKNYFFLSHPDWDHMNLAVKASKVLGPICLWEPPLIKISESKTGYLKKFKICDETERKLVNSNFREIQFHMPDKISSNDSSRVFEIKNLFLVSGDSSIKMEKVWAPLVTRKLKYFALAHHGSQTSTSPQLVQRFTRALSAFASARKSRYGHPHRQVIERLHKKRVPALSTELFGTLRIILKD